MKQNNSKLVTIGIVLIVILTAYLGYQWFGPASAPALTSGTADASSPEVQDLLNFLNELKTIKIDTSIFSNPGFLALQDGSVTIAPQQVGRKNPFAPF